MVYATQIITLLIIIYWITFGIIQLSTWLYWIQTKEYRLDRFTVLLKSKSGRSELMIYSILLKIFSLLLSIYFRNLLPFFVIIVFINLVSIWKIKNQGIRKPVQTQRLVRISFVSVFPVSLISFGVFMYFLPVSFLLAAETLLLVCPAFGVLLTKHAVDKAKSRLVEEASDKLLRVKPTIVAITGSYGKSTTKEFVAHLLNGKYKTLSSYKNQNTVFGLGRVVLDRLEASHKFFVAEMGAYKIGEIREMTEFVRPDIAMLTGIEPQHIELFGSLENIKKAKFEIIEALDGGTAIVNVSGCEARELHKKSREMGIQTLSYALENTLDVGIDKKSIDMLGKVLKVTNEGLLIEINYQNKLIKLQTNLTQDYLVENLVGAILVARLLNVEWVDIKKQAHTLELPEKTTQIIKRDNGVIIDDSYNSTPKGFRSALKLLNNFNGEKVVLTSGIIELGDESDSIHKDLVRYMKEIKVDKVYLTRKDIAKYFRKSGLDYHYAKNPKEIELSDNYVLLIEGRIPAAIYKSI